MQHSKTGNTGYGYIIATEVIYEKFIERILRSLQEYHNEYLSEAQISLPFAKPMDGYMPTYHTVPDNRLMIKGEAKLLIDAKYKDNFKTGTRKKPVNSDVYQLFSSMVAHGCERGILLSPCDAAEKEDIHHKKPLSEGGTHDRSNLIALCKPCHSQIHAKRGDRWHDR